MTEKTDKRMHVVYLGETGFPYGLASIQKTILLGKALVSVEAKMTVLNRKGKFDPDKPMQVDVKGEFEGIQYVYTSGTVYKPKKFLERTLQKIKGAVGEFNYLRKLAKNNDLDAGIISSRHFSMNLLFKIYSVIFNFPVVLLYVELGSAMAHRKGIKNKINDFLIEKFMLWRMDGALPISEILEKNFKELAPGKPILKIPVICDFKQFDLPKRKTEIPYFFYCGAMDYKEVIDFILESYDLLPEDNEYKLYLLISGGKKAQYEQLKKQIQQMKKGANIKVFSNVPFSELVDLYLHAKAMLIPLRPTMQDAARFPHKIGEYTAAANPIITTNVGEIPNYFEDEKTALMAKSYEPSIFAEKMKFILDYPEKAKEIGENGKELGLREFNYLSYGQRLKSFLNNLGAKAQIESGVLSEVKD